MSLGSLAMRTNYFASCSFTSAKVFTANSKSLRD